MAETTRERIEDLIQKGLTARQIADLLRVSTQNVYKHLKALGIDPPTNRKAAS